jgi:F0F1-type ATP synthase assembly protein I
MENILEKADAQVAESTRKLSRATSAMADAIDEGVGVIQRAVKRSGDLAEELMDDTTQRVKRHPAETIAATLAFGLVAGLVAGTFIGWMLKRR